jgi:precorrin-6B C5,15-methyltransferase / cobalt-precorrin-6B C5,C15-methyltransferase
MPDQNPSKDVVGPPTGGLTRDVQGAPPAGPAPWLHVVGIGEDGLPGLSPAARAVVAAAEVIMGGDRHHALAPGITAERIAWPSPFDAMIDRIRGLRGRRLVILVTGDPLWFSVGARIARAIPAGEITFYPALSAFQLAACRMGWSLADTDCLTAHGRPPENILPFVQPGARLLVLTTGADTPARIAALLTTRGWGPSRLTVLSAMGGPDEARQAGTAEGWSATVPAFNTLAVDLLPGPDAALIPRGPGLPDHLFRTDGTMTKAEVRAITLSRLMPMRGALLWDIGAGAGSVGIEWMRMAPDARAIAVEPRADRRALAAENALALGAPRLDIRAGEAPGAFAHLPDPDAVFLGGGLSAAAAEIAMERLGRFGRLVANAVTVEGEVVLTGLHVRHGGGLSRIGVERAEPVGGRTGWRPLMTVTQWHWTKG